MRDVAFRGGTGRLRSYIVDVMAGELRESGCFSTLDNRQELIDAIGERSGNPFAVAPDPHEMTHLLLIVRSCGRRECIDTLVECAGEMIRGSGELRLLQLRDEWDATAWFTETDWYTIRSTLLPLTLNNAVELFRNATSRRLARPPTHSSNIWHIFTYLASLGGDESVPLFMIFLRLVADQLEVERARPLKRVLDRLAGDWDITEAFQRATWVHGRAPTGSSRPRLQILIEPYPLEPGAFTVTYWSQWDPEAWSPRRGTHRRVRGAQLEEAVEQIVQAVEAGWPSGEGQLLVEFILPLELLDLPVETWRVAMGPQETPKPLLRRYPVVVRSLERMRTPARNPWCNRWNMLMDSPPPPARIFGQDAAGRLEQVLADERIAVLVLGAPPEPSEEGGREIRTATEAGIPIIMWCRRKSPGITFRQAVDDVLIKGGAAELPNRVWALRITASMNDNAMASNVWRDIVLLWDDPYRVPPEIGS
jgi:hypothetical protein